MYLAKEKRGSTLYQGYKPQLPNHQEVEVQVYASQVISRDISKYMQTTIRSMSAMLVNGLAEGGNKHGRK